MWNRIEEHEPPLNKPIDLAGYDKNGENLLFSNVRYNECKRYNKPNDGTYVLERDFYTRKSHDGTASGLGGNGEKFVYWKPVTKLTHPDDIE